MELNEEQKLLLDQLDKVCQEAASVAATREVEARIVTNPALVSSKEGDWKRLYEKNYQELFGEIRRLFFDFSGLHALLTPYLDRAAPDKKEKINADFQKILHIRDHLIENMSKGGSFSMQECCGMSEETLNWIYDAALDYINKKEWHKGATICRYINFLNPHYPDIWAALGYSLMMQNQLREALQAFAVTTVLNPDNVYSRLYSAEIYMALGEKKDARIETEQLERILKHHPEREVLLPYLVRLKNEL